MYFGDRVVVVSLVVVSCQAFFEAKQAIPADGLVSYLWCILLVIHIKPHFIITAVGFDKKGVFAGGQFGGQLYAGLIVEAFLAHAAAVKTPNHVMLTAGAGDAEAGINIFSTAAGGATSDRVTATVNGVDNIDRYLGLRGV